jgi:hypothetical protein
MPAPYVIIPDGDELFGIDGATFAGFIVESYSITTPANRVDLDDGNGEPLGSTIVPQRKEVSLTVQVGDSTTAPTLGGPTTYAGESILITSVDLTETQADYRRYSLSGYVKIN